MLLPATRCVILPRAHVLTLLHHRTGQPHAALGPVIAAVEFFHPVLTDLSHQCVKGIFNTL